MAIRYFLSLSCLFHALVLIFFLSLYPNVSAEAIRGEIVVYIVEPMLSANRAEEIAGEMEKHGLGPVPIPVEEDAQSMPVVREEREIVLPVAESPAEEFTLTEAVSEVADLAGHLDPTDRADNGEGGLLKSGASTPNTLSFNMEGLRGLLIGEIRGRKTYPASARKLGIEGEVHISFRVFPDGQTRDISANGKQERLTILERAAVELIRNASPFSLPSSSDVHDISAEGVPIQLVISYHLEEGKGGGRE
ncbi:MAG: TonB family protein [Nitrospirota bacterium]|nr:TonB family protein [Nitrospirota bacterium]